MAGFSYLAFKAKTVRRSEEDTQVYINRAKYFSCSLFVGIVFIYLYSTR